MQTHILLDITRCEGLSSCYAETSFNIFQSVICLHYQAPVSSLQVPQSPTCHLHMNPTHPCNTSVTSCSGVGHTYQPRVPNALTVHAIESVVHSGLAQKLGSKGAAEAGDCFTGALHFSSNEG